MADVNIPIQMAPGTFSQSILPGWQFNLFSINLGDSSNPEIERRAIENIGSYGKQIGHLAEALEVVINELKLLEKPMGQKAHDALQIFMGDVAAVRGLKPPRNGGAANPPDGVSPAGVSAG